MNKQVEPPETTYRSFSGSFVDEGAGHGRANFHNPGRWQLESFWRIYPPPSPPAVAFDFNLDFEKPTSHGKIRDT